MGIYNCADTLVEALESLETQTYKNFKVILCDDGSKDATLKIAKEWADTRPNYTVIQNEHNMGLNVTLNHCLKYVDTEFVARMEGMTAHFRIVLSKRLSFWMNTPNML